MEHRRTAAPGRHGPPGIGKAPAAAAGLTLLVVALILGGGLIEANAEVPPASPQPVPDPAALHARALVVDAHNDVPLKMVGRADYDFGRRMRYGHTDLPRMIEGGLDAAFLAVWVDPRKYKGERAWRRALVMFRAIEAAARRSGGRAALARSSEELLSTTAAGKVALLVGVEGAQALGKARRERRVLARLERLYRRGARYMTLTWMTSNPLAGSSCDAGRRRGLSRLGHKVVARMNRLGMMVDLSHASDRTFFDTMKVTRSPVILSHSSARTLSRHRRNASDEMLRAVKANRGVVCVNFYAGYLDSAWMKRAAGKSKRQRKRLPRVPLSTLVDHIHHVIQVAGVDHVCLGSDFDGVPSLPVGIDDVSGMPALTSALLERGYAAADVEKILGRNILRVMKENERLAGDR